MKLVRLNLHQFLFERKYLLMYKTPHKEKLQAAIQNPKCKKDVPILEKAFKAYEIWINQIKSLTSTGKKKVEEMTKLLNGYKDFLEVELISQQGSPFIKRQKGQLKLDNSVLEEFLIHLIDPSILSRSSLKYSSYGTSLHLLLNI